MMEAVADILSDRMRQPRGLNRTVVVSLLAHAALLAAFFLMPSLTPAHEGEREVMQISLGGAPGPRAGGMTPMGGRPVQAPAARTPEMTLPSERARPAAKTPVKTAPPEATSRTPTRGSEPQAGSSVAE